MGWLKPVFITVEGFQSKMELENMKWKKSHDVPSGKWNLSERLSPTNAWFTENWNLTPDQWTLIKNLPPSSSQWTHCVDFDGLLHSLPVNTARPKASSDLPVTCYSLRFQTAIPLLFLNKVILWWLQLASVYLCI